MINMFKNQNALAKNDQKPQLEMKTISNSKFAIFLSFWISKMYYFRCPLHPKEWNVDIRYHTESQGLRIQPISHAPIPTFGAP